MAIPHVYPMFLLILSLFCLPTLLAIPFQDCGWGDYPIKVTGVEVFEKQNKASLNITGSTRFVLLGVNIGNKKIIDDIYEHSELITCPVSPGPIVLPLHKLFPYSTEEKMRVSISVNDPDHEEIMCLYFNYDTSSTGVVFA
ncbi:unnamed protein product [Brassica oleracea var. botrytis]